MILIVLIFVIVGILMLSIYIDDSYRIYCYSVVWILYIIVFILIHLLHKYDNRDEQ